MKTISRALFLIFPAACLSACSTTFGGAVLVLGFRDIIYYVVLAFVFALIIGLMSRSDKRRKAFWTWFILSLVLTPLAGFIYLLVLISRKNRNEG